MSSSDDAAHPETTIASVIDTAEEIALEAPVDLKEAGLSQRDALLELFDEVEPWRSPEGEAFASVQVDGHTRTSRYQITLISQFNAASVGVQIHAGRAARGSQ